MMKITTEEMEKAVLFLAETDQEYARRRAYFNGLERQLKTVRAMQFMRSGEKTASAREQAAMVSPPYTEHLKLLESAELDYLEMSERRSTSVVLIDCWRSLNAARSRGVL